MDIKMQSHTMAPSSRRRTPDSTARSSRSTAPERLSDRSTAGKVLQTRLRDLTESFGLSGGVYVHLGHSFYADNAERAFLPTRFVAASSLDCALFLGEGALGLDPVVRRAASAYMPYAWTTADYEKLGEGQRWLAGRLERRGVYGGVAAPIQDYAGGPAYVTMYSAFNDEAQQIISVRGAELAYSVTSFHQDAKVMLPPFRRTNDQPALTARELDCLRLATAGRTVNETSALLKVTARTVEFHLKNAGDKLGASNKLTTVAIAISSGLISM